MSKRAEFPDFRLIKEAEHNPIAHKGNTNGDIIGNTLVDFRLAVGLGSIIEADAVSSADGVALLYHPSGLPEEAGSSGDIPASAIQTMDYKDIKKSYHRGGEPILALREAIEELPEDTLINLDIKTEESIDPTVKDISETHAADRFNIASFRNSRRAAVVDNLGGPDAVSSSASEFGVKAIYAASRVGARAPVVSLARRYAHHAGFKCVQMPFKTNGVERVDERLLDFTHDLGLPVHAFGVDEVPDMRRLLGMGVNGIITDYPGRYWEAQTAHQQ